MATTKTDPNNHPPAIGNSNSSDSGNNSDLRVGVAGTTCYGKWEKVSQSLLAEVEKEDAQEKAESAEALGHTRQPFSESEAAEKTKFEKVSKTKAVLESHKQREDSRTLILEQDWVDEQLKNNRQQTVDITRQAFEVSIVTNNSISNDQSDIGDITVSSSKRVLRLNNIQGPLTITLSSDLSQLESTSTVETDKGDREPIKIYGLTKVFLSNLQDVTIISKCKIITSSMEISHCSNLRVQLYQEKVSTIQCDLSRDVLIEFIGVDLKRDNLLFGDVNDKIYHAGVSNLTVVARKKSGDGKRLEKNMDYLKDGAVAEGSATAEEYQFITHVLHGELITERLLRLHNKHVTERELKEQLAKENAEQIKKQTSDIGQEDLKDNEEDNVEEEIYLSSHPSAIGGTISSFQIKDIICSCEQHKAGGNEAFQNGEYMQAILLYTRGIDESVGVESFFSDRHVLYANRSACFLKMGHHEKALEDAQTCVDLQPSYIKGHFRKGLALHALKRFEDAMPCLVHALQMEPKNKQIQQAIKFCEVNLTKELRKRMEGK